MLQAVDSFRRNEAASNTENHSVAAAQFETDYRQAVASRLDTLELFGVENLSNASRRQRVTVAFVSLRTSLGPSVGTRDQPPFKSFDAVHAGSQTDSRSGGSFRPTDLPIEAVLARSRRLLIRGIAGSGKTTVLQWIAVRAALRDLQSPLEAWNSLVPLFIRLRDHRDGHFPDAKDLPREVAGNLATFCPPRWTEAQLLEGRAVVLVDGVDEVAESLRSGVREWLKHLTSEFPRASYIVTSRPMAADEDWLTDLEFDSAELMPLDPATIPAFIVCWHQAVKGVVVADQHAKLDERAANLISRIRQSPALREIASLPLLCALLCALNHDHEGEIPDDRLSLYEAACKMLVERRDRQRGIRHTEHPGLTEHQKLLLLQDLAYWLLRNDKLAVSVDDVDACLARRLGELADAPEQEQAGRVRQFFQDRSGLIRSPEEDVVEFVHNTFREYLASREVLRLNDIGVLVKNSHDDRWREVVLLAAGRANVIQHRNLTRGIMTRGDRLKKRRVQLHLLAAACRRLSSDNDPTLRDQIEERLRAVVPPHSTDEAVAVAAAGDLAIPYLQPPQVGHDVIAACIAALGGIGSEAALDSLAQYAEDPGGDTIDAVLQQWRRFDADEFGRRILPCLRRHSLQTLDLSGTGVTDAGLAHLVGLPALQSLGLSGTGVTDAGLARLRRVPNLRVNRYR